MYLYVYNVSQTNSDAYPLYNYADNLKHDGATFSCTFSLLLQQSVFTGGISRRASLAAAAVHAKQASSTDDVWNDSVAKQGNRRWAWSAAGPADHPER